MLRHIVAWNFKEGYSIEEKMKLSKEAKERLEKLTSSISCIKAIQVKINLNQTSNREVVLNSLFQNEEDLERYQIHPHHKEVGVFIREVFTDRVCLDFKE